MNALRHTHTLTCTVRWLVLPHPCTVSAWQQPLQVYRLPAGQVAHQWCRQSPKIPEKPINMANHYWHSQGLFYSTTWPKWTPTTYATNQPTNQPSLTSLLKLSWKLSALVHYSNLMGARKMAQWVEAFDAKPNNLNSIPGIQNVPGGSWEPLPQIVC